MFEIHGEADSKVLYDLCTELGADYRKTAVVPLASDIDTRIAAALAVPVAPYANSLEAAFALRDIVFPNVEYLNVDFREYFYADHGMSYHCDVRHEYGEGCGRGSTRARALVCAILMHVIYALDEQRTSR
jgi:hypothetical protein